MGGVLGIAWGSTPDEATNRLRIAPLAQEDGVTRYALDQVAARLRAEGVFCPSAFAEDRLRPDDFLELSFDGEALVGARANFGYAFRHIGMRSDALSDSAMTLLARGEFHGMLAEVTARYGAPSFVADDNIRIGNLHVVGTALFVAADGGPVQLFLGHEAASLAGEMRWLASVARDGGF